MRIALGVTCPLDNSDNQDYKAPRLPPKLINQCLADVFTYLFNETRVIVAVEYAHYIDTLSWNVLLNLANKPSRALMVFTVSPVDEILSPKQVSSKLKSQDEVFLTTGKIVWTEKLSVVFRRMVQMESTILVRQSSYSVLEVYELLRSALDQSCPGGLACMVHQLSGGDPFWCREMVLYIKDTGDYYTFNQHLFSLHCS